MKTKLTLSVDKKLLERARRVTKSRNKSLSGFFEECLKEMLKTKKNETPITDSFSGILKEFYADKSYEQMKEERYKDKYGI